MARFFSSKYSGKQIEKALDTMLSPTSDNKFGVADISGATGSIDMFPVGAIYITTNAESPAKFLPNTTWQLISDRVLIGAGNLYSVNATGGSKDAVVVKHGGHIRGADLPTTDIEWEIAPSDNSYFLPIGDVTKYGTARTFMSEYSNEVGFRTIYKGEDGTDKNLPPYFAAYIWRRVE